MLAGPEDTMPSTHQSSQVSETHGGDSVNGKPFVPLGIRYLERNKAHRHN